MNSIISTAALERRYGTRRGIEDVNLQIPAGKIFGFLGPNGAGKSTTIRVLLGFLKASSGSATIFGMDCWRQSAHIKRRLGYVPGDVRLYPWLTLNKALRFLSHIRGTSLLSSGRQMAERFRVEPDIPVRKMSRGNRQKVALVLALAHQPELVIMDEPTSGLDPLMQETLCDCLREIATAGGTVFFSSHTLSEVEALCDQIAIVKAGRIVVNDSLTNLKQQAPRRITVDFPSDCVPGDGWPDGLELRLQNRNRLEFELRGCPDRFIHWAAQQPITDVTISAPSLEALFRGYYTTGTQSQEPV
ncbi:MAG: ABC transporter ATP-binding protein [Planctomycetaceae bacterium]|nr:ABC transporter ATP-binding protein [Planctomycetaceae bacterium]